MWRSLARWQNIPESRSYNGIDWSQWILAVLFEHSWATNAQKEENWKKCVLQIELKENIKYNDDRYVSVAKLSWYLNPHHSNNLDMAWRRYGPLIFFFYLHLQTKSYHIYVVFQESCEFSFTYSTQLSNQENKMQLTNKISLTKNSSPRTKKQKHRWSLNFSLAIPLTNSEHY